MNDSNEIIRSVVPSPEIDDVRESRIENHQHHKSTINIVEGSNGSVVCTLGQPVESMVENVIVSDETSMVVKFSKTITNRPIEEVPVVTNSIISINDSETVNGKKQSSVSLEKPRRHLLETHL